MPRKINRDIAAPPTAPARPQSAASFTQVSADFLARNPWADSPELQQKLRNLKAIETRIAAR